MLETKECVRCRRTLPVSEFKPNRRTVDGLQVYCKDCAVDMNIRDCSKRVKEVKKTYLYDSKYNKKKEMTIKEIAEKFETNENVIYSNRSKKQRMQRRYYVIDENIPLSDIKRFYASYEIKDEVWKEIEGSYGEYLVSNYGRFKKIYNKYPKGKFLLPYYTKKRNVDENKQFIKVKFQGVYKEYSVARLVAYHFVDVFYEFDKLVSTSKDSKYKNCSYDELVVYHKNGLIYDNYSENLEWLDRKDLAKKTAYKGNWKGSIAAIDAQTGEVIGIYRTTREAEANLYVSRQAISDSLNNKRKTNIACGKYIFKYEDDLYKSKVMI